MSETFFHCTINGASILEKLAMLFRHLARALRFAQPLPYHETEQTVAFLQLLALTLRCFF